MRSNAAFGQLVHLVRADLHLDGCAKRAEQRGMQRLIAVRLGNGDVVLEFAGKRFVQAMQYAEREIARGNILDQDAKTVDIQHLREGQRFGLHLLVDAIQVFLASAHFGLDVVFVQTLADRFQYLAYHFAPIAACHLERFRQHRVAVRIQILETEVFQLLIQRVQAQTIGDGRIDVHRFAGDALALFFGNGIERAHIVQAIGEFDQNDAHISRHRHQHLAEVFRLRVRQRVELELVQFAQAIHQFGHGLAELLGDLFDADVGVFRHVMQQSSGDGLRVQVQRGQDAGNGDGVGDVWITRLAQLTLMCGATEGERRFDLRHILRLQVGRDLLEKNFSICLWHGTCGKKAAG